MKALLLAAALTALTVGAAPETQEGPALELQAVRFYRAGGAQTLFDGFFRVPFAQLDPLVRGPGGVAAYRVAVSVRDSADLELVTQSWVQTVPVATLNVRGASAVEHFAFAARPGRYAVQVAVTDSATGRVLRTTASVTAFDAAPGASDLLLATALRQISGPADSAVRGGEIRKGDLVLQASGRPVLTPQQARIGYYLELYTATPETATVTVRVRRTDGSQVVATAAQPVPLGAGGGATRGLLDLAGLPPGEYRLELRVQMPDSERVREAPFGMAGFETEAALAAVAPVEASDVFAPMPEARLDTLYAPLIYLMSSDEQGIYPSLPVDGKRNYLRQFWAKRDPTPGTPRNEAQEDFYRRMSEAQRRYGEGGAGRVPGWRTDRGRIFIKYGPPDDVLSRPQAGNTGPYEVWKYTRVRSLKYVFLDQTGFGNYALIWTSDRREPSRANWQDLLGREAVLDVERF